MIKGRLHTATETTGESLYALLLQGGVRHSFRFAATGIAVAGRGFATTRPETSPAGIPAARVTRGRWDRAGRPAATAAVRCPCSRRTGRINSGTCRRRICRPGECRWVDRARPWSVPVEVEEGISKTSRNPFEEKCSK